ncbi:uncharacterized protein LOC115736673 [Rhodamnia argentea]|uniref:Uncharacterized protein LOC115736673 n=1 Tax=Rhodamnia argentea TaxID=178133 RepID=A0A8B8NQB5_9MYRT|nr:uncharacterized protein LOC115736673 [Rhodamnia argentea]
MGTSSSEAILVLKRDLNAMEDLANFLSRKTSPEFQEVGAQERSEQVVELPSLGELGSVDDDDDGFKTPTPTTSSLGREAETLAAVRCPPAPRKAPAVRSAKRKDRGAGVTLLDLTDEIDSLFPPAIRRHLYGKIKKAKLESSATALCSKI